jgi:hypothetical protein
VSASILPMPFLKQLSNNIKPSYHSPTPPSKLFWGDSEHWSFRLKEVYYPFSSSE